jgi:hypothetical protein
VHSKSLWAYDNYREKRNAFSVLEGKPEAKRPLGKT